MTSHKYKFPKFRTWGIHIYEIAHRGKIFLARLQGWLFLAFSWLKISQFYASNLARLFPFSGQMWRANRQKPPFQHRQEYLSGLQKCICPTYFWAIGSLKEFLKKFLLPIYESPRASLKNWILIFRKMGIDSKHFVVVMLVQVYECVCSLWAAAFEINAHQGSFRWCPFSLTPKRRLCFLLSGGPRGVLGRIEAWAHRKGLLVVCIERIQQMSGFKLVIALGIMITRLQCNARQRVTPLISLIRTSYANVSLSSTLIGPGV